MYVTVLNVDFGGFVSLREITIIKLITNNNKANHTGGQGIALSL